MNPTITTKFHGPTETLGSRVSATTITGKRLYYPWDYAASLEDNHASAARALFRHINPSRQDRDWPMFGGEIKDGYVWVFVRRDRLERVVGEVAR